MLLLFRRIAGDDEYDYEDTPSSSSELKALCDQAAKDQRALYELVRLPATMWSCRRAHHAWR